MNYTIVTSFTVKAKDENEEFESEWQLDENLDKLDQEFLLSLCEDYRIMFNKEIEYQESNEYVDENIRINEYEFTKEGLRS